MPSTNFIEIKFKGHNEVQRALLIIYVFKIYIYIYIFFKKEKKLKVPYCSLSDK